VELCTARLRLTQWTERELSALHRLWSDPQTIWWGPHQSLEQTRALLLKIEAQGGWWAVHLGTEIIGNVFLRTSPRDATALELGYHFLPSAWGQGYATEAARALLETAPGRVVEAPVVPDNARSQSVMRRLGFAIARQLMHAGRLHELWIKV
jgi:ribosomal-protein-alanine N-acetyltransferase